VASSTFRAASPTDENASQFDGQLNANDSVFATDSEASSSQQ